MPYNKVSNSRNSQIIARINASNKNTSATVIAFIELLKIDTKQPNPDFLRQFTELMDNHLFIKDLCQRSGFFGSPVYDHLRGDDYRANRFKTIIDALKLGSYNGQSNEKIYYFGGAPDFKKELHKKIEKIINNLLKSAYVYIECDDYKRDSLVLDALEKFNKNNRFESDDLMLSDIQETGCADMYTWEVFAQICTPDYLSLNSQTENNNTLINIRGRRIQELKQEAREKILQLPENIQLFHGKNLNADVGKQIKKVLLSEVTKIKIMQSITSINAKLPSDQQIERDEISLIVDQLELINAGNLPIFLAKSSTGLRHSIIITKIIDGYSVLIKPRVKNQAKHKNLITGTTKIVKTSGVQINLDEYKSFKNAGRMVTVSMLPGTEVRDNKRQSVDTYGQALEKEKFTKVVFTDASEEQRVIYTKEYLGEDLVSLLQNNKLNNEIKKKIAQQIIEQFNWDMNDIKLENILWDEDTGKVSFIDTSEKAISCTTPCYKKFYNTKNNPLQLMSQSEFKDKKNKQDGELAIDLDSKTLCIYRKNKNNVEAYITTKDLNSLRLKIKDKQAIDHDDLMELFVDDNHPQHPDNWEKSFGLCYALFQLVNNLDLEGANLAAHRKPTRLFHDGDRKLTFPFAKMVDKTYLRQLEPNDVLKKLKKTNWNTFRCE